MKSTEAVEKCTFLFEKYNSLPQEIKDFAETLIRSNFKLEKEILELKKGNKDND